MTQKQLGEALGMAQTWVSKLENPEYGKMTVATLLRLATAFDTDLEIKFRPFSTTLSTLPTQGPDYFKVPSFQEEESNIETRLEREEARIAAVAQSRSGGLASLAEIKTGDPCPPWFARLQLAEQSLSFGSKIFEGMNLQQMAGIVSTTMPDRKSGGNDNGIHLVQRTPEEQLEQAQDPQSDPSTQTMDIAA